VKAIRLLRDVAIPLRDGVQTSAEVWLPDDGQAHPAMLVRTPYLKETAAVTAVLDSRLATARGYAVVLQDVRGRGASGGVFDPFVHEEADGSDTVAWVAEQPWCDGRVVMSGISYVGATQWQAAVGAPT
jgi:putative CocE/NonD family hydrolase